MSAAQIFVTGGTGLVGTHLLRQLVRTGHQRIRALRRPDSSLRGVADVADRIEWITGDLTDYSVLEEAMQGVDYVYHCAAVIDHRPSMAERMEAVNVTATTQLVNLALDTNVQRFIHVSSVAAIGRRPGLDLIDEKTDWQRSEWNSRYAVSKRAAELEVWRGQAEGLSVLIVNPSLILGPGRWEQGTGKWFANAYRGMRFYPAGGGGFVDVRDVADWMVAAVQQDVPDGRYILSAENLSYREVFNQIADALQRPRPATAVTPLIREAAWRWEALRTKITGGHPLVTRETARNSMRTFHYDGSLARRVLDFEYRPIQATIRDTAAAFLADKKTDLAE